MFVRLAPDFLNAIAQEFHEDHPGGELTVVKDHTAPEGPAQRPPYRCARTRFVLDKIREGILEEVRDFEGIAHNDPEAVEERRQAQAARAGGTRTYTAAEVDALVEARVNEALDGVPSPSQITQFIADEVARQSAQQIAQIQAKSVSGKGTNVAAADTNTGAADASAGA